MVATKENDQIRRILDGEERQVAFSYAYKKPDHECGLILGKWSEENEFEKPDSTCEECGRYVQAGTPDSYRGWFCGEHDVEWCLSCVPVVLRTEFEEDVPDE